LTELLTAFDALAMVPGWDHPGAEINALKGGLSNRTFHVRHGDRECVLRLDSEQSGALRIDRSFELQIMAEACRAGLGPEVLFSDPEAGVLATEYLPGRAWDDADLQSAEHLEALAALLRRVHSLPLCGHRLDLVENAVMYENYLEARHDSHSFAARCVEVIQMTPQGEGAVCCHNDIVAGNVIDNTQIKLIDWEYSCDNDPMFDLASAIGFHNLDDSRAQVLLSAYSGGHDGELIERLAEQVRIFDAIQWLWLATRQLVIPGSWQARRLEELQQRIL